jgi:hypothetical protein
MAKGSKHDKDQSADTGQPGPEVPSAGQPSGDQTSLGGGAHTGSNSPEPAANTEKTGGAQPAQEPAAAQPTRPPAEAIAEAAGAAIEAAGAVRGAPPLPQGPTIEQWVGAGYPAAQYPPDGFAERPSPALTYFRETGIMPELPKAPDIKIDTAHLVPMNNGDSEPNEAAKLLLLDACDRFGVVPTKEVRPKELLAWNYYGERVQDGVPASVVIVTAGGVKLRHYEDPDYPMEPETEERLAIIFNAYRIDKDTGKPIRMPLPTDLALPLAAVTGIPTRQDHVYRRGYLKEGGRAEANRRASKTRK